MGTSTKVNDQKGVNRSDKLWLEWFDDLPPHRRAHGLWFYRLCQGAHSKDIFAGQLACQEVSAVAVLKAIDRFRDEVPRLVQASLNVPQTNNFNDRNPQRSSYIPSNDRLQSIGIIPNKVSGIASLLAWPLWLMCFMAMGLVWFVQTGEEEWRNNQTLTREIMAKDQELNDFRQQALSVRQELDQVLSIKDEATAFFDNANGRADLVTWRDGSKSVRFFCSHGTPHAWIDPNDSTGLIIADDTVFQKHGPDSLDHWHN